MRVGYAMLIAALPLAGCGPMVDNPNNVPKLGRWEHSTKVLALIANDVWIDRDKVPFKLPEDETEIKECFEPALKSAEQINADMMRANKKMCTLGALEWKGQNFTSTGTCGPQEMSGNTVSGTVELNGMNGAERALAKVSVQLIVKGRTGAAERVRFGVETRWKRLGDCTRG